MSTQQPTFQHRGYSGTAEVSREDDCLFGRVLHINDVITFEGQTLREVREQFEIAVDEYLVHCKAVGKQPDRPS